MIWTDYLIAFFVYALYAGIIVLLFYIGYSIYKRKR